MKLTFYEDSNVVTKVKFVILLKYTNNTYKNVIWVAKMYEKGTTYNVIASPVEKTNNINTDSHFLSDYGKVCDGLVIEKKLILFH